MGSMSIEAGLNEAVYYHSVSMDEEPYEIAAASEAAPRSI